MAKNTERKRTGAYYTPQPLADALVRRFVCSREYGNILEPSCGDGAFLSALAKAGVAGCASRIDAVEIDSAGTEKARGRMSGCGNVRVMNTDFLDFYLANRNSVRYGLVIGNPPYVAHKYLDKHQQETLAKILTLNGLEANGLANLWAGFVAACTDMLDETGRLALIIPADILRVKYAAGLREFLADRFSAITVILFKSIVFPDIQQDVVVLVGERGIERKGIRLAELEGAEEIDSFDFGSIRFREVRDARGKWTEYLLGTEESRLTRRIRNDGRFRKFGDIATVNVGVTTGNNRYFCINRETADKYGLHDAVLPLIGKAPDLKTVCFTADDWKRLADGGKEAYLVNFPDMPHDAYPRGYREYILAGEARGVERGYKCSVRDPWYRVPNPWIPDAFLASIAGRHPKLVLNRCGAVSTDSLNRIKFNEGIAPEQGVISFYNSITFAFTELCGRSYGGGAMQLTPGETRNIPVPVPDMVPAGEALMLLERADSVLKGGGNIEDALDIVDENVLVGRLGIKGNDCETARHIWRRLQSRRTGRN